jgi:DNA-binding SARP family transcriptional activator
MRSMAEGAGPGGAGVGTSPAPASPRSAGPDLTLVGGFRLQVDGTPLELSLVLQRLVALLALRARPVRRALVAGVLWPDCDETRARANLRSALWRLRALEARVVDGDQDQLCMDPCVSVDVDRIGDPEDVLRDGRPVDPREIVQLGEELLPGWYEDWVLFERERLRQHRLRLLEEIAVRLAAGHRFPEAVEVALAAIAVEPLRESAHRVLVRVHLDEGNVAEALRAYDLFERRLGEELSLRPSAHMRELLATAGRVDADGELRVVSPAR